MIVDQRHQNSVERKIAEATGVYWKPVWHILDDGEFEWCWRTPRT
jgi:hypothetical protein